MVERLAEDIPSATADNVSKGEKAMRAATIAREAFLNQLAEGVIVANADGAITFVNSAAEALHGQALLGVGPGAYTRSYNLLTMDGEPYPDEELPLARAVLRGEIVNEARWRIRRGDGSEILAIGSARPIHDASGNQIGAVLTIRDDTRRHADELALQEALRAKEALLHEVNHRVKNSLQLVTSLLSLQAMRAEDAEVRQGLEEASKRVSVVARIHQRLYTTSEHDRVEIGQLLSELAEDIFDAHRNDERIAAHIDCAPAVIALDQAVPLALCVSELLVNAMKYAFPGDAGGTLRLAAALDDDGRLTVQVEDNGIGLPSGFDPAKSSGLGMRIVQALARQLRADLGFSSVNGHTRFTISFQPHALEHQNRAG